MARTGTLAAFDLACRWLSSFRSATAIWRERWWRGEGGRSRASNRRTNAEGAGDGGGRETGIGDALVVLAAAVKTNLPLAGQSA